MSGNDDNDENGGVEYLQEKYDIIKALSDDYLNIYAVYPDTDSADVIKLQGYVVKGLHANMRYVPYTATIAQYADERVHPQDRKALLAHTSLKYVTDALKTNNQFDFTYRTLAGTDTHYFSVRYRRTSAIGEPMRIIVGFRNVDDVMEAESRSQSILEESQAIAAINESMGSCYWHMTFDENEEITTCLWTPSFRKILGYQNELDFPNVLESWTDLIHPDHKEEVLSLFYRAIKDRTERVIYDVEYPCLTRDRGYRWFREACRFIRRADGTAAALHGIFIDIDSNKKKDQALKDALAAAKNANKAKTSFLNNMSHDIRTPMNAIIGFTALAAAHLSNTERVRGYLSKIQTSSNHLLALINDVLDMSRIESGRVTIVAKNERLPDILQDLSTIVQDDITRGQLEFFIDTADVKDKTIVCDRLRLNQVLLNLVNNAMKFTKPGGKVRVKVTQVPCPGPNVVSIRPRNSGRAGALNHQEEQFVSYIFEVSDSGIGIGKQFLPHLFEPFAREENTTVSGIPGTGLGLSITKNLVALMGGNITVQSEQGKGTVFTVALKFAKGQEGQDIKEITPLSDAGQLEHSKEFAGRRLLLVEDNELNREIAVEILQEAGFKVESAVDGEKALDAIIRMDSEYFDAILMDVQMPVMDGYEATKWIRQLTDKRKSAIPIIAMTANAFEEDKRAAFTAGMTGYISKPIDIKQLMDLLRTVFTDRGMPVVYTTGGHPETRCSGEVLHGSPTGASRGVHV